MPIVNINLKTDAAIPTGIVGASVGVYTTGAIFVTSGITDGTGLVSFSLPVAQYRVYVYKQGVSLVQPQILNVVTATTITYDLTAHEKILPETLDPELTRISGYINESSGAAKKELTLTFYHEYTQLNGNTIISSTPVTVMSDKKGYFEFDLYRNMKYCTPYLTERPLYKVITPDRPSIKLTELLFQVPVLLTTPSLSYTVTVNNTIQIPYTLTWSDYVNNRGYQSSWAELIWSSSNANISVVVTTENIEITGLQPGVATFTFDRNFLNDLVWKNPPPFISPTLTITVT